MLEAATAVSGPSQSLAGNCERFVSAGWGPRTNRSGTRRGQKTAGWRKLASPQGDFDGVTQPEPSRTQPPRVIRRRRRKPAKPATPATPSATVEGSGTAWMLIDAGRFTPELSQVAPLFPEIFVTGLIAVHPLVLRATGKSPSALNAQLKSEEAFGAETTAQYELPDVSDKFPKLKLVSVGIVVDTVAV